MASPSRAYSVASCLSDSDDSFLETPGSTPVDTLRSTQPTLFESSNVVPAITWTAPMPHGHPDLSRFTLSPLIQRPAESSHQQLSFGDETIADSAFTFSSPRTPPTPPETGLTPAHSSLQYTFKSLHNITPRTSPKPEKVPTLPSSIDLFAQAGPSIPLRPRQEPRSDVHTEPLCSKEKLRAEDKPDNAKIWLPSPPTVAVGESAIAEPAPEIERKENPSPVPYDPRNENPPIKPFFSSAFQNALKAGLKIARDAATALEPALHACPQSGIQPLLENARAMSVFQGYDTKTIAVLGDTGEGKSSLISSLLHHPEIARSGDTGSACTSVVTEYRNKTNAHTEPITIEVEYLSNAAIDEMIVELLWKYRQLFLDGVNDDTMGAAAYASMQRESERAWSALEAAFQHCGSFTAQFLQDTSDGALERITEQLQSWARDVDWPEGGIDGKWTSTASNAEECSDKTSLFMKDKFWPFTKIIRVYLSAQVLKTGIVLADLPGLQDTNLARVRATEEYLMKCDHVFVVANISRAIADSSLKSSLYSVIARHVPSSWETAGSGYLKVAVVCTRSEDISEKSAKREWCGPDKLISELDMAILDQDIALADGRGDRDVKKSLKNRRRLLLINARNEHVKAGLKKAYATQIPGGRLDVFCVSNRMYEKATGMGDVGLVNASGIPELRRFCHDITANAQLLEAKHFLRTTLSTLLNSTTIWAQSLPDPSAADERTGHLLRDALEAVHVNTPEAGIGEKRQGKRDKFGVAGIGYSAWCRRDGDHGTFRQPHVNWNARIIWSMRSELELQWDDIEEEIPNALQQELNDFQAALRSLQRLFEENMLPVALSRSIDFAVENLEYRYKRVEEDLLREIRFVRKMASEPTPTSYILRKMIVAYRAAAQETGTGTAARQKNIVQGLITSRTLFPDIITGILRSLDSKLASSFSKLDDDICAVVDAVRADLHRVLDTRAEIQNDEAAQRSNAAKQDLAPNLDDLNRRHTELLDRIVDF